MVMGLPSHALAMKTRRGLYNYSAGHALTITSDNNVVVVVLLLLPDWGSQNDDAMTGTNVGAYHSRTNAWMVAHLTLGDAVTGKSLRLANDNLINFRHVIRIHLLAL